MTTWWYALRRIDRKLTEAHKLLDAERREQKRHTNMLEISLTLEAELKKNMNFINKGKPPIMR